ncbi:MAG: tetratricopeptide repeat protein, partial [Alphaproteobacteria bacterium]|nr:tetratricopeptide repeat protein [Alphaproteobacteria bacterium]
LSALGRREEALEATREAADIYRRLAEARPDAFLPDLASALNNLGIRLSALGRREEALEATREAVEIRRRLAEARPDAFLPDLARSLGALGGALGDAAEAIAAFAEGIACLRPAFERLPQAHGGLMGVLVELYRQACQAHGREPDPGMLAPILPLLG